MTRENAWFADAMAAVTRVLPFGLSRIVAPSVVGYAIINLCTFFLDFALLALFKGQFRIPLPIAVTLSYGTAGVASYLANRVFNFRSEAAAGKQFPVYVAVMVVNYVVFVEGLTNFLAASGVYFLASRFIAACVEGVYLYCCMRWLVFRDTLGAPETGAPETEPAVVPEGQASDAGSGA